MSALRYQYRMAADIMTLSNTLVYNDRLICGSADVAAAALSLPGWAAAAATWPAWLQDVLRPEQRVTFLDTDGVTAAREVRSIISQCIVMRSIPRLSEPFWLASYH